MHGTHLEDELINSWRSVRMIEAMIKTNTSPTIYSLIPHASGFARVPESLLLVFALSVLEDSLRKLRESGMFQSQRSELSALMKASKATVSWQDYEAIDSVRHVRNGIAHRGEILENGYCAAALTAIARELLAWRVIPEDPKVEYNFSIDPSAAA